MSAGDILARFKCALPMKNPVITQLKHEEDDELYRVWRIEAQGVSYILKQAKEYEAELYQTVLNGIKGSVPELYGTAVIDNNTYLLMEYVKGSDLRICSRNALTLALDALIAIQRKKNLSMAKRQARRILSNAASARELIE